MLEIYYILHFCTSPKLRQFRLRDPQKKKLGIALFLCESIFLISLLSFISWSFLPLLIGAVSFQFLAFLSVLYLNQDFIKLFHKSYLFVLLSILSFLFSAFLLVNFLITINLFIIISVGIAYGIFVSYGLYLTHTWVSLSADLAPWAGYWYQSFWSYKKEMLLGLTKIDKIFMKNPGMANLDPVILQIKNLLWEDILNNGDFKLDQLEGIQNFLQQFICLDKQIQENCLKFAKEYQVNRQKIEQEYYYNYYHHLSSILVRPSFQSQYKYFLQNLGEFLKRIVYCSFLEDMTEEESKVIQEMGYVRYEKQYVLDNVTIRSLWNEIWIKKLEKEREAYKASKSEASNYIPNFKFFWENFIQTDAKIQKAYINFLKENESLLNIINSKNLIDSYQLYSYITDVNQYYIGSLSTNGVEVYNETNIYFNRKEYSDQKEELKILWQMIYIKNREGDYALLNPQIQNIWNKMWEAWKDLSKKELNENNISYTSVENLKYLSELWKQIVNSDSNTQYECSTKNYIRNFFNFKLVARLHFFALPDAVSLLTELDIVEKTEKKLVQQAIAFPPNYLWEEEIWKEEKRYVEEILYLQYSEKYALFDVTLREILNLLLEAIKNCREQLGTGDKASFEYTEIKKILSNLKAIWQIIVCSEDFTQKKYLAFFKNVNLKKFLYAYVTKYLFLDPVELVGKRFDISFLEILHRAYKHIGQLLVPITDIEAKLINHNAIEKISRNFIFPFFREEYVLSRASLESCFYYIFEEKRNIDSYREDSYFAGWIENFWKVLISSSQTTQEAALEIFKKFKGHIIELQDYKIFKELEHLDANIKDFYSLYAIEEQCSFFELTDISLKEKQFLRKIIYNLNEHLLRNKEFPQLWKAIWVAIMDYAKIIKIDKELLLENLEQLLKAVTDPSNYKELNFFKENIKYLGYVLQKRQPYFMNQFPFTGILWDKKFRRAFDLLCKLSEGKKPIINYSIFTILDIVDQFNQYINQRKLAEQDPIPNAVYMLWDNIISDIGREITAYDKNFFVEHSSKFLSWFEEFCLSDTYQKKCPLELKSQLLFLIDAYALKYITKTLESLFFNISSHSNTTMELNHVEKKELSSINFIQKIWEIGNEILWETYIKIALKMKKYQPKNFAKFTMIFLLLLNFNQKHNYRIIPLDISLNYMESFFYKVLYKAKKFFYCMQDLQLYDLFPYIPKKDCFYEDLQIPISPYKDITRLRFSVFCLRNFEKIGINPIIFPTELVAHEVFYVLLVLFCRNPKMGQRFLQVFSKKPNVILQWIVGYEFEETNPDFRIYPIIANAIWKEEKARNRCNLNYESDHMQYLIKNSKFTNKDKTALKLKFYQRCYSKYNPVFFKNRLPLDPKAKKCYEKYKGLLKEKLINKVVVIQSQAGTQSVNPIV